MRLRDVLHFALGLVPVLAVVAFINARAQPVPIWDEWSEPLDNALKTAEGTITFADLARQYNDSRPLFTNLTTVVSVHLTRWDLKAEMFFKVGLALLVLAVQVMLYRRLDRRDVFVVVPYSLLLFSLTQRHTWLWSIQNQYHFLLLFLAAGLLALSRKPSWPAIVLAAVAAFAATWSYANGFFVFFFLGAALWLFEYRRLKYYVFWTAASAAGLASYFYGYDFRVSGGELAWNPFFLVKFVAAFLGNALLVQRGAFEERLAAAIALGAVGLVLFTVNVVFLGRRGTPWPQLAPWLVQGAFVVASGLVIGAVRGFNGGLGAALPDRYLTLVLLFWVAFAALALAAYRASRGTQRRVLAAVNAFAAVLLVAVLVTSNVRSFQLRSYVTPEQVACLRAVPSTGDVACLRGLHPVFDPEHPSWAARDVAVAKIERLAAARLNVFAARRADR